MNYLGVRVVVTQVPKIPAARAAITIIPTHNLDDDALGGSFSFSLGFVGPGWAVMVGKLLDAVDVAELIAVGDAGGVVVGGGSCVAPL